MKHVAHFLKTFTPNSIVSHRSIVFSCLEQKQQFFQTFFSQLKTVELYSLPSSLLKKTYDCDIHHQPPIFKTPISFSQLWNKMSHAHFL